MFAVIMGPTSTVHRFVAITFTSVFAALLSHCGPLAAPPSPCPTEPCSTGTPRFTPGGGGDGDGSVSTSDAALTDVVSADAATPQPMRGTVAEVRSLPRVRPENTVIATGWSVRSLTDSAITPVLTDVRGTFSILAPRDSDGIGALRAQTAPNVCAIGHSRASGDDVSILSLSAARIAESLAPTGFTVDPSLAHVVVEVENALRARVRGVSVGRSPGGTVAVAYDAEGGLFGILEATGPQGTAVIPNLDAPATPVKIELVLTFEMRTRRIPIYVARGCTTFVTTTAP